MLCSALAGVLVALLVAAAPALGANQAYWSNAGNDTISFANLDGTGGGGQLNTSGATPTGPRGVAIDAAANKIYWTNFFSNTISFANLDGTGGGQLNTTGATVSSPYGVAVDPAANKIYWANLQTNTISFANLDGTGGGGQLNTAGATVSGPAGVAVDPAANKIYWANNGSNTISFANLDNTGGGAQLGTTGATVNRPGGVAIDAAANKVYWANNGNNTISFANRDGTGGGGQLDTTGATVNGPFGVAIDPAANKVYWANLGNNTISFANRDGTGGGGQLNTTGATVSSPQFLALLELPAGAGAPVVSGGSTTGSTLTCSQGAWAPDLLGAFLFRAPQGYTYGWTRDGATIPGATSSTLVASSPGDYACQVTADNHAGATTQSSAPHAVSNPPSPAKAPVAMTGAASNLTHTSGILHGTVNPNGAATTYFFQYGASLAYGRQTSSHSAGADTTAHPESVSISGLSPGVTYHYRIVAHNAAGTSDGADRTFTTPARPLALSVSPARTRAGTRACFAFEASSSGHPVAAATVRFAGHTARTTRAGKATICLRLSRGSYHPTAAKTGYKQASTTVTVSAAPTPRPAFTG